MPTATINNNNWSHITNINLADSRFYQPNSIDLLLRADVFPNILQHGRIVGNADEPVAINTIFGWVLMGKCQSKPTKNINTISLFTSTIHNDLLALDNTIKTFWELEEVPILNRSNFLSPEEELCENIFSKTHTRTTSGRYVVKLPFKNYEPQFDFKSSRSLAIRRFISLERRLLTTPDIYKKNSDFIKDYLDSDYLEQVHEDLE